MFYNVQKSGYISTSDFVDVVNPSSIYYEDSVFGGEYLIFNSSIGSTSFSISLDREPEQLSYASTQTSVLNYTTDSKNAKGPIDKVAINFGGVGYKELPSFVSIASTQGVNASLLPDSRTINKLEKLP